MARPCAARDPAECGELCISANPATRPTGIHAQPFSGVEKIVQTQTCRSSKSPASATGTAQAPCGPSKWPVEALRSRRRHCATELAVMSCLRKGDLSDSSPPLLASRKSAIDGSEGGGRIFRLRQAIWLKRFREKPLELGIGFSVNQAFPACSSHSVSWSRVPTR